MQKIVKKFVIEIRVLLLLLLLLDAACSSNEIKNAELHFEPLLAFFVLRVSTMREYSFCCPVVLSSCPSFFSFHSFEHCWGD